MKTTGQVGRFVRGFASGVDGLDVPAELMRDAHDADQFARGVEVTVGAEIKNGCHAILHSLPDFRGVRKWNESCTRAWKFSLTFHVLSHPAAVSGGLSPSTQVRHFWAAKLKF